jgi:hypothetical protein
VEDILQKSGLARPGTSTYGSTYSAVNGHRPVISAAVRTAVEHWALDRLCSMLLTGGWVVECRASLRTHLFASASSGRSEPGCGLTLLRCLPLLHMSGDPGPKPTEPEAAAVSAAALAFFRNRASAPRDMSAAATVQFRAACDAVLAHVY